MNVWMMQREKERNDGRRKTMKWVCRCETGQERKLSPISGDSGTAVVHWVAAGLVVAGPVVQSQL